MQRKFQMAKGNRNGAEREMVRQIVWLFQCLPCNFLVYLKSCINANVTKTCIKKQEKGIAGLNTTKLLYLEDAQSRLAQPK